ncbi:MAG: hypothetical protein ACRYG7_03440 [Janthinobacterium lividum]
MTPTLFILLILVPIAGLVGLLWWRFGGKNKEKAAPLVASENHASVTRRHYGPAPAPPVVAPLVAAPPLAADNPLSQLMPEEDFKAQKEKDLQAEADRIEAEQRQTAEEASQQPTFPETGPDQTEQAKAPKVSPATTPQQLSSRYAPGATVSVFDVLGLNETAPVVDEAPTATAPEDDSVPESLFDNPVSADAPTKNDKANRAAAAELRRRTREAIKAEAGGNKAALTSLLAENNPPR